MILVIRLSLWLDYPLAPQIKSALEFFFKITYGALFKCSLLDITFSAKHNKVNSYDRAFDLPDLNMYTCRQCLLDLSMSHSMR